MLLPVYEFCGVYDVLGFDNAEVFSEPGQTKRLNVCREFDKFSDNSETWFEIRDHPPNTCLDWSLGPASISFFIPL